MVLVQREPTAIFIWVEGLDLLLENGNQVLLEDGDAIVLEDNMF